MAAVTPTIKQFRNDHGVFVRYSGTGTDNSADTMSTSGIQGMMRLIHASVKYDNAATQAGVTTSLDSGAGSAFDVILDTGAANAEDTTFIPSADYYIFPDDAILLSAPAGGSGVIASFLIVMEAV